MTPTSLIETERQKNEEEEVGEASKITKLAGTRPSHQHKRKRRQCAAVAGRNGPKYTGRGVDYAFLAHPSDPWRRRRRLGLRFSRSRRDFGAEEEEALSAMSPQPWKESLS